MSNSRFALLGLVCLFASACTVVLQPAPGRPQQAPPATEPEIDVGIADPEPTLRPPVQQPRRRPSNPDPSPVNVEPETPSPRSTARVSGINLGIPPGHLPDPGECRVWVQGTPPGRQLRAQSCHGILATAPVGSWILYRPAQYERQVRVRYLHAAQRKIVAVRAFDAETGAFLRDFALAEDDDNMTPRTIGVSRPAVRPNNRPTTNRGNGANPPGRSGNARERVTSANNNGVAVGRTDSTKVNRPTGGTNGRPTTNPGNGGNPPGRSGNARERDTSADNNGVAVGRIDSTKVNRPAGGTNGRPTTNPGNGANPPGRSGNARERDTSNGNNGVARGRADSTVVSTPTGRPTLRPAGSRGNNGNQGREDRPTNTAGKPANPRPDNSATAAVVDTTSTEQVTNDNRGASDRQNNTRSRRRDPRGNVAVSVGQADSTDSRDGTPVPVRADGSAAQPLQPALGIDVRHFPGLGMCRVWVPGLPYGRQARPTNCNRITNGATAGSWILRQPRNQPDVLVVDYIHAETAGLVVRTSSFDATNGAALHSARMEPM